MGISYIYICAPGNHESCKRDIYMAGKKGLKQAKSRESTERKISDAEFHS